MLRYGDELYNIATRPGAYDSTRCAIQGAPEEMDHESSMPAQKP
jgi:hypothetical protein